MRRVPHHPPNLIDRSKFSRDSNGSSSHPNDLCNDFLRLGLRLTVVHGNSGALGCKPQSDSPPKPLPRASNERNFSLKRRTHWLLRDHFFSKRR
jgi:hypothetical protein